MEATLTASRRTGRGKNEARRLRQAGQLPAVLYGGDPAGRQPTGVPISIDPKALLRVLHSDAGINTLINLTVEDGVSERVMVKEYQLDPIRHSLLHADFYRVAMDRVITVTVPIVLRGEAPGVKQQAGLLDFVTREVEIECLPGDIPEHLVVDVSHLALGQGIRLRDLAGDLRWTPTSDPDTLIVHVMTPKLEAAPEAAAAEVAAAPAEPEVMKRGKAEAEEGEEA